MNYLLVGIGYFVATILSAAITFTLIAELRARWSRFVLLLATHFMIDTILFGIITIDLIARHYGAPKVPFIGIEVRVIMAITVLSLLLYDMWVNYFTRKHK